MKERLQKILSARGVASRREAESWIAAGRVTCNGAVCTLGDSADPETDVIAVDGIALPPPQRRLYILLNKPRGYVTTLSDERGRKTAASLVAACGERVYPVGRLDMDSEGLLLFTNDGDFANRVAHPAREVGKTYRVWVRGFGADSLVALSRRVVLDGYRIRAPHVVLEVQKADSAVLLVTIHEGRNRQIRRMCAMAGLRVTRLMRIAEGDLTLGSLRPGEWRFLTDTEIQTIKKNF